MILGIGTALPVGIVGGLFHMINHAMYKSACSSPAARWRSRPARPTSSELGGLAPEDAGHLRLLLRRGRVHLRRAAVQRLLLQGTGLRRRAGARHWSSTSAALLGSFFTAASFLKLGHAAFLGPRRAPSSRSVKEAPAGHAAPDDRHRRAVRALRRVQRRCRCDALIEPAVGGRSLERAPPLAASCRTAGCLAGDHGASSLAWRSRSTTSAACKRAGSGLRRRGPHPPRAGRCTGSTTRAERRWFDPYDIALQARRRRRPGRLVHRPRHRLRLRPGRRPASRPGLRRRLLGAHTGSYAPLRGLGRWPARPLIVFTAAGRVLDVGCAAHPGAAAGGRCSSNLPLRAGLRPHWRCRWSPLLCVAEGAAALLAGPALW